MSGARRIALFPASFDPVTNGHLDIAQRALRLFDEVVLAVAMNVAKTGTFSLEDRLEMLRSVVSDEPRLTVTTFEGLTVDYAREVGAVAIIRGVRAMSDFEYEFEMALMNKHLYADVETLFMSLPEYFYELLAPQGAHPVRPRGGRIRAADQPNGYGSGRIALGQA
jgi:pantetheine-phosphate adenylyltransferase